MADDFQPNNWWNTSKNCNEHTDSNLKFSSLGYSASSSDWNQTQMYNSSSGSTGDFCSSSSSSSYGCSETMSMMQSLIEPDTKFHPFLFENQQMTDYQSQMMTYGGGSNEIQHLAKKLTSVDINQMQFADNSSFWDSSSGFCHSSVSPVGGAQFFETKPSFSSFAAKSSGGHQAKKTSSESVLKKPRIETPAPFKVRKEKLGDKITALQQLVSPFGKTDTASVLHEAIEYIKYLHDQVSVLCTPYLMNAQPTQQQKKSGKSKKREESMQDLRSLGICLVPIASTYKVTGEATSEFWSPTFEGSYS